MLEINSYIKSRELFFDVLYRIEKINVDCIKLRDIFLVFYGIEKINVDCIKSRGVFPLFHGLEKIIGVATGLHIFLPE